MSDDKKAPTIIEYFADLTDPRIERCRRHKLVDIIFIAICGVICGADSFTEMEDFGLEPVRQISSRLTTQADRESAHKPDATSLYSFQLSSPTGSATGGTGSSMNVCAQPPNAAPGAFSPHQ